MIMISVLEKQYMETVIRMGRRLQNGEIDWEQRRYEIAKEIYPTLLLESAKLPCDYDEKLAAAAVATVNAAELLVEALKARPLKEVK